jgi:large subunit ribosomal protein L1
MKKIAPQYDAAKTYTVQEAVTILKGVPHPKFDESVELAVDLGIDPKQSDQLVRAHVTLPHGTGKKIRTLVFCKGEAEKTAKEAGADYVGCEDLVQKISGGWTDFDVAIATPDLMRDIAKLGKVLGPRGLMPNPKSGTVTQDVGKAIREAKAGKIEFKTDKQSGIRLSVGKVSFAAEQLVENITVVTKAILSAKPASLKGHYVKGAYLSTSMGPGLKISL